MAKNGEKMHFLSFRALLDPFFHNFPNRCFSNMQGEVLRGSKKPTSIVAMLMHFFRVTTAKEGCIRARTPIEMLCGAWTSGPDGRRVACLGLIP